MPLAYLIRKSIVVQSYGENLSHETPDDEMIARLLHLLADKNKMYNEQSVQ